jgi:hypothetical protein
MQGSATQAMPVCILEERQRRRCPLAAAPRGLRFHGPLALLLAPYIPKGMLVARALPSGMGACSKMPSYCCAGPQCDHLITLTVTYEGDCIERNTFCVAF